MRDTDLVLIGFAGALRRSELATLTLADVEAKPGGLLLHLCLSRPTPNAADRSWVSPTASKPIPTRSPP